MKLTTDTVRTTARRLAGTRLGARLRSGRVGRRLGVAAEHRSAQYELLADVIPDDHAAQVDPGFYIDLVAAGLPDDATVLDLGCGAGKSKRRFRLANDRIRWLGVDLRESPEGEGRPENLRGIAWFDGVRLPFGDESVDCVFSKQVMEHVRYPALLLDEVRRVLRRDGWFVGTTSNLEPFHSFSYWNFTPFGFRALVEQAGLELVELRPGIDGPTLIERQLHRRYQELGRYFSETSPVNAEIICWGERNGHPPAVVNDRMLQYCGHFGFVVRRR